jgi:BASS family bile acid:Na+ symporter
MKDLIVEILKIVTPVSVALIVFAQGLGIAPSQVGTFFKKQPGLMLRSLIATLVLVPVAALALILVLKPWPALAIALAILVACPPAPLMFKAAPNIGGGSAAFMASLHLTLAALAFLTVPIVLDLLSIPLGFHANVDIGALARILARTILIPIGLGLVIRAFLAAAADRIAPMLGKVGTIGLLVVVLFALVALYPALLNMDAWSYLVIAAVSAAALAIGHLSGPNDPREKTILAVECGVRHPVLALNIAVANFGRPEALPVLVPCVLAFIAIAMVYLIWRGRSR